MGKMEVVMTKLSLILASILLVSCEIDSGNPSNAGEEALSEGIDKINACAEILATVNFESSKRMDILKSYGFKPFQAQVIEGGIDSMSVVSQMIENDREYEKKNVQDGSPALAKVFTERASKKEACFAEYGLTCLELLQKVEAGMTEEQFVASQIPMLACISAAASPTETQEDSAALSETPPIQYPAKFTIPVTISIAEDLASYIPVQAALFVFVYNSGTTGMPLAVKRLAPRGFPLSLQLSDFDLLKPGVSLADFDKLDVSARISMTGVAASVASGDYLTEKHVVEPNAVTSVTLHLSQRAP